MTFERLTEYITKLQTFNKLAELLPKKYVKSGYFSYGCINWEHPTKDTQYLRIEFADIPYEEEYEITGRIKRKFISQHCEKIEDAAETLKKLLVELYR